MMNLTANQNGYVALMAVIIMSAGTLAVAVTLLLSATDANRAAIITQMSVSATAYAHSCGEEALQQLRDDTTYTAAGSLTFAAGSCSYTITNTGGNTRTIAATGTSGDSIRKVNISATLSGASISITSWQEVNN